MRRGGGQLEASQHLKGLYAHLKIIRRSNKFARSAIDGKALHNYKMCGKVNNELIYSLNTAYILYYYILASYFGLGPN